MKGCLLRLAMLPLIVGATYVLLSLRSPFPSFVFPAAEAEVVAPLAGFFFWFAALYLLDARQARANLALALQALARGLRDGEKVVVHGSLEAHGPLLAAPFTGESCVGYTYAVTHYNSQMKSPQLDYEGCALTPTIVRGPAGSFGILAPANKELFHEVPDERLASDEAYAHAEAYLKATDFGVPGGLFGNVAKREVSNGPGDFRIDVSTGTQKDLRSCKLSQKVLRPGDQASVAGVYVESQHGIAPDPDTIMKPFHVVPGGEAALARKIRSKRIGAVVCALLGLVVVAVYFLLVVPAQG